MCVFVRLLFVWPRIARGLSTFFGLLPSLVVAVVAPCCCCCCCCRRFRVPFSCHKAHNMRCIYAKSAGHAGLPLPVPVPVPASSCCRCRCLRLPLRLVYSFVAITFQPLHTTHSPLFPLFFLSAVLSSFFISIFISGFHSRARAEII